MTLRFGITIGSFKTNIFQLIFLNLFIHINQAMLPAVIEVINIFEQKVICTQAPLDLSNGPADSYFTIYTSLILCIM